MTTPPLAILYLDNHVMVVNKPPGLLSQGDESGDPTVLSVGKAYLKERFKKPGRVFLSLMHRLDRPASGVMVLARTSKAARRLTEQFRRRTPEKCYLAIVEGPCVGEGSWEDYLVKERRHVRVVSATYPRAKHAVLHWQSLAIRDHLSLVEVRLETGRSHQIRVQFAHRGWPLLGDMRYGAHRELDGRNLALHCYRLTVTHPTKRERMTWEAAPPLGWPTIFDDVLAPLLTA